MELTAGIGEIRMRILLGLFFLVALMACDKKPEGQTVAVVNGDEITASELNAELAGANLPPDADKKLVTSRALQSLIDRRLLADQAKKDGVDRSPEFISRQRRATEELLIGMLANRQMEAGKLPTDNEISAIQAKYPQLFAKREVWALDQLQFRSSSDAAFQAKLMKSKTLEEIATVLSGAGIPFQRGRNQLNTTLIPADMYPRLAGLPIGQPFIVPDGGRSVASAILSRSPAPLAGPTARTEAVNLIRRQSGTQLLEKRLKDVRATAKIDYKAGFAPAK
jgi:EpsD family peptidyl-prolyl cis-trans isomerase